MRYIPISLRRAVIERAANRCEYCKLAQAGQEATFHIDHVSPIAAGGKTVLENLALACVSCLLSKSDRQIIAIQKLKQTFQCSIHAYNVGQTTSTGTNFILLAEHQLGVRQSKHSI